MRQMATTPEGKVKDKVKSRFAREFPYSYRFMPVQNGMGAMTVDMLYCIRGRFVGIETKRPPKPGHKLPEPTPRQRTTMDQIKQAGDMAFLIYDDDTLEVAVASIHMALWFDNRGQHVGI